MLKSLYAYRGTHSRTLAFNAKEKFLEIGSSKDPNWVHVINENGKLGYVPKNYMTLEQVSSVEMLELIDACIEGIHLSASEKSGSYSKFEQEALQILVEKRQEWYNKIPPTMHPSKRPAPPPPCRTSSQLSVDSIGSNFSDGSLPSPCQPPPSSISTPIQATTSNLVSLPDSKITIRPQRQSSEIEIITSFIGRGNSLVFLNFAYLLFLVTCSFILHLVFLASTGHLNKN
ncbi:NCK-interacting protein with SH3 domain [Armadillidium vulgare]|nr:NCK-interacting protein with SH3 domain [Armadillidium vulgare]